MTDISASNTWAADALFAVAVSRRSRSATFTSKGAFSSITLIPAKKSAFYEKLIRRIVSTEQFDELDKCNLLCRPCHGAWTNQRLRGKMKITLPLPDGRLITRKFTHHGMILVRDGKPTIYAFADNPQDLQTYAYSLGTGRQVFRAGFELERQLARLMLATRRRKFLHVWDGLGVVFRIQRLDANHMRYEQNVRFTLMKFVGAVDENSPPHFWVRNGKAIVRGQGIKKKGVVRGEIEYAAIEQGIARRKAKNTA